MQKKERKGSIKMNPYYDSLEFYNSIKYEQGLADSVSTKPKKEDPIITNKILVIFGIVAVIKICVLLLVT